MDGSFARSNVPQPVASASYDASNQVTQFGSSSFSYDANGNLLSDGVNSYTWDARNRLVAIAGTVSAGFQYDAFGRRVSKTIGAGTTNYLYDGGNPIQEGSGGFPNANLLTGLNVDEYFQRNSGSEASTFLTDALGSTQALANQNGAISTQYGYEPFGNTSVTGNSSNPYQFTGRENDGTGLSFYRARYYNPMIGRFISEDPIGLSGGQTDLYAYVGNDPVNFFDPFGLDKKAPWFNTCVAKALGSGALSIGADALGFIPGEKDVQAAVDIGAGTFARQIGNWNGYRGIVADQFGARYIASGSQDAKAVGLGYGLGSGGATADWLSLGLNAAGLIPGLNEFAAGASIVYDGVKTAEAVANCH